MNTSHMILARVNCKVSTLEEKPLPSTNPTHPSPAESCNPQNTIRYTSHIAYFLLLLLLLPPPEKEIEHPISFAQSYVNFPKKKKKIMQNMKLLLNYLYWKRKRFIEIRGTPWSHSLASPPVVVILKSGPRIYITYIHFPTPFPLLPSPFPFPLPLPCRLCRKGRVGGVGRWEGGEGEGAMFNDFSQQRLSYLKIREIG